MKCINCPHYKDHMCSIANAGRFSEIDDISCLLRLILVTIDNISEPPPDDKDADPADYWKL